MADERFPNRDQTHWSQQTGFLQRIILSPMAIGCKSPPSRGTFFSLQKPGGKFQKHEFHMSSKVRIGRKLFISDQAIDPAVCHLYRKMVFSCDQKIGYITAERWFPEDSKILSVKPDGRSIANLSKIQNPASL